MGRSNCFVDHGSHLLSLESLAVVHPQEHYNPADFERPRIQSSSTPPRCVLNALLEDDTDNGCLFVPCCVFLSYEGSGESGEDQINAWTLNFCFRCRGARVKNARATRDEFFIHGTCEFLAGAPG